MKRNLSRFLFVTIFGILSNSAFASSRVEIIDQEMNCIQSHLKNNITWNDTCILSDTNAQNSAASQVLDALEQAHHGSAASKPAVKQVTKTQVISSSSVPVSTQWVSDSLGITPKGWFNSTTAYNYSMEGWKVYNASGAGTQSRKTYEDTIFQQVTYGVTNDLNVWIWDYYGWANKDADFLKTGASSTGFSQGLFNPTWGAEYRLLNQSAYPADVDFTVNYSPSVIHQKQSGLTNDGNMASGYQTVALIGGIGRSINMFSIELVGNATYLGTEKYTNEGNENQYMVKPVWNYGPGLNTTTHVTNRFSVNLNLDYWFMPDRSQSDLSTGSTWIYVPGDDLVASTVLNYWCIPGKLLGGLTYAHTSYSNSKNEYANPVLNSENKNNSTNAFGVQFQYIFK